MSIPSPDPKRAAVPGPAPSPLPGVPGVPDHSTLSGEDLARSLFDDRPEKTLVAVTTVTDLERDRARSRL